MKLLNKGHAAVAAAASTDETRGMINGVHLVETKAGLKAVATDGEIMVIVEDVTGALSAEEFPANVMPANVENTAKEATIPVKAFLRAVKSIPKKTYLPGLSHVAVIMGTTTTTLGTTDLETPTVLVSRNIEGHFPNYEQAIPTAKAALTIGFSPTLLMRACKIAAAFGLDTMKMELTTEKCPLKITGTRNGQNLTIVVMPMRLEDKSL